MRFFYLLIFTAVLGCNSGSHGYKDLDVLYADMVNVLKAKDENKLKQYCHDITPDAGTIKFMKKHNFSYRGLPEELEKQNMKVSAIGEDYFSQAVSFKDKLKRDGQLDNLEYIGREKAGEELINKDLNIYATETFILLKSNNDTIRCKLGEMFKIDGVWKSFTRPKLGW